MIEFVEVTKEVFKRDIMSLDVCVNSFKDYTEWKTRKGDVIAKTEPGYLEPKLETKYYIRKWMVL
jgi:hypothetical protein